ncbi:MAG: SpoIVB peptidase, partial [Clostridia bacterium]|nr:SpoIVB peptidase [Clostridia bacterium]
GRYKLGLFVRDALEGIGTLTFVKKDGTFMALGHPVCDEDGKKSDIVGGKIMPCSICGVNKGERGRAGELKGAIIGDKPVGEITANYQQGIKGIINDNFDLSKLCEIEIGTGVVGKAEIFCCVDGKKVEAYAVSVVKAEHDGREDKNFVVKVTDKRLIRSTGGIVQGMSGSPIVQGGKLIGALTHVFTNDPTRGYGISAENMLAVCDEPQEKAA